MKDWKRPVRVVAVKDAEVRNPEWREELKEWVNLMEDRFGEEETPVGPIVTKEWIKYVEELEEDTVPKSDLEELVERWREKSKALREVGNQTDFGIGMAKGREKALDELEAVLEE